MIEPLHVMLVEDNPADVELTREMLEASKLHLNLTVAGDGVTALELLRGEKAEGVCKPDLILLDLNIPRKTGSEVLEEIKQDAGLKRIPVIVLTSSDAEADIVASYNLGANCYITKPVDLRAFQKIVQSVNSFWFTVVRLP